MRLLDLAVDALATYRLARLFTVEDAPPALAARGLVLVHAPDRWHGVTDCQHCAGLWAALAVGVLRVTPLRALSYPLAVAGLQSLAVTLTGGDGPEEEPQGPVQAGPALTGRPLTGTEHATGRIDRGQGVGRRLEAPELHHGRLRQ